MYVHYCALFVYIQSVQAASEEWDVDDTELAVPVSIPEAPVQIGDLKPAEVVFLTSPEEFCIQVRIIIIIIIISCYPLQGRRASTKRRHLILFLASFLTSPRLFASSSDSLWTDFLHVSLSSVSPADSNPKPPFQWLHFLSTVYALSNSISAF